MEESVESSCSKWSAADKKTLLFLLHQHGSLNLKVLQQNMPHKTVQEISDICNKHMELAEHEEEEIAKKKKQKHALKSWVRILRNRDAVQKKPIDNIIPRVLRYIALFEKRAPSAAINLSECYEILADMCRGIDIRELKGGNLHFLRDCLKKLADEVQSPGAGNLKKILRKMDRINEEQQGPFDSTLNPLCLSEDVLKLASLGEDYKMLD